ncbi:MAG: hypothetical protein E6Q76_08210 [Rhizobium sp.]|nr:MAG: hypothetical protein E6Q76_08210 [Rhizobium sp.]
MDERLAVEKLIQQIKQYAAGRASDVARGAETPRLAALLVQKYGHGAVNAVATIFLGQLLQIRVVQKKPPNVGGFFMCDGSLRLP